MISTTYCVTRKEDIAYIIPECVQARNKRTSEPLRTVTHATLTMGTAASSDVSGASGTSATMQRNGSVTGGYEERGLTAPAGSTSESAVASIPTSTPHAEQPPAGTINGGWTNSNDSGNELLELESAVASVPAEMAHAEHPPAEATNGGRTSTSSGDELLGPESAVASSPAGTAHAEQPPAEATNGGRTSSSSSEGELLGPESAVASSPAGTAHAEQPPAEATNGGRTSSSSSEDELLGLESAVASIPTGTAPEGQPPAEVINGGRSSSSSGDELPVAPAGADFATHHERQKLHRVSHLPPTRTVSRSSSGTSATDSQLPGASYSTESRPQPGAQEQETSTLYLVPIFDMGGLGMLPNAPRAPEWLGESPVKNLCSDGHAKSSVQKSERLKCESSCFFSGPTASGFTAAAEDAKLPELLAVGRSSAGDSPGSAVSSTECHIASCSPLLPDMQVDRRQVAPITSDHVKARPVFSVEGQALQNASLISQQEAPSQPSEFSSSGQQQADSQEQLAHTKCEPPALRTFLHAHGTDSRDHERAGVLSSSTGTVPTSAEVRQLLEEATGEARRQAVHSVDSTLPQDSLLEANYVTVTDRITESSYSSAIQLIHRMSLAQSDRLDFSPLNGALRAMDGLSESSSEENELERPPLHVALVSGRMSVLHHVRSLGQQVEQFAQHVQEFSLNLGLFTAMVEARPSRVDCCPQQGWTCEHVVHVFTQVIERFTYMTEIFSREVVDHPEHKKQRQAWFNAQEAFRQPETHRSSQQKAKQARIIVDNGPLTTALTPASDNYLPTSQDCASAITQVTPDMEEPRGVTQVVRDVDSGYESQRPSPETEEQPPPPSEEVEQPQRDSVATSPRRRPRSADAALLLAEEPEAQGDNVQSSSQGSSQRGALSRFLRSFSTRGRKSNEKNRHSAPEQPRGDSD